MSELPEIKIYPENIPDELKALHQWLNWRYEVKDEKLTKIPCAPYLHGGATFAVSTTKKSNTTTFEEALKYTSPLVGLAFGFFVESNVSGIDLDKLGDEEIEIIVKAKSYTEYSPSHKGVHILGYGRTESLKKAGVEMYSENRFFTVTGDHIEHCPAELNDIQEALDFIAEKYGELQPQPQKVEASTQPLGADFLNSYGWKLDDLRKRDPKLDTLLSNDNSAYKSASEADFAAVGKLLYWGYGEAECIEIVKNLRGRKKLNRRDYFDRMFEKLRGSKTIANKVDVEAWNPVTGSSQSGIKFLTLLNAKYQFYCDRDDPNLTIYWWDGCTWKNTTEALLLKERVIFYGKKHPQISKVELLEYYKGLGLTTQVVKKPHNLVSFNNGLFDINTNELLPHDSNYFCINTLPHDHDSKASCPKWLAFQKQIHHTEDLVFVQEYYGCMLWDDVPLRIFLFLIGGGGNGKTIETTVITHAIGEENVTNTSLATLTNSEYGVVEFYHKLANICDNMTQAEIRDTGKLNALSGGSKIHVRQIYGKAFDMLSYAKIAYASNDPPIIHDESDAFWDRIKYVDYPARFADTPKEGELQARNREDLIKDLESEMPGIINWLLEGLVRWKNNGFKYSYNKSTDDVKLYYKRKSNPVLCWKEEMLEYTGNEKDDWILKTDMYPHFYKWVKALPMFKGNRNVPSADKFFKTLKAEGVEDSRPRDVDQQRTYVGYRFKDAPIQPETLHETLKRALRELKEIKTETLESMSQS